MADKTRRAVVVDDDEQMRMIIRVVLEMLQIGEIVEVGSGEEAIEALRGGGTDIVVMDWMMPGMTGIDCTRIIRSGDIAGIDSAVPIVMLTAVTGGPAERMAREAGATLFMHKTSSIKLLFNEIKKAL
jgi:CheY-like chemotaxis protein